VEHAETAVTDSHTDTELLVRAVDEIPRHRQRHLVRPQRVVRAWRHHPWQWIAFSRVLITNRLWRIPGRIAGHRGNACGTHWRPPALTSYTQRIGMHHRLIFRVVVQTIFSEVDHDTFARSRRQDKARRQDDVGALARQPWVDARIGCDQLEIAQIIGLAEACESVFVFGLDDLNFTHHVFTF